MADIGSILAAFVKGGADVELDRLKDREDQEREMKKLQMLEQLRRETAKELAEFEENLPSAKLRRAAEEQRMKHADEEQILDREEFGMKREEFGMRKEQFALDTELKREDQQMQRERLALDRASTSESIQTSRAARARYGREDREAKAKDNILFAEWDNLLEDVTSTGVANEAELMGMRRTWYEGVNKHGWDKNKQREYIMLMNRRYANKARAMRAKGHLPSQRKLREEEGL